MVAPLAGEKAEIGLAPGYGIAVHAVLSGDQGLAQDALGFLEVLDG